MTSQVVGSDQAKQATVPASIVGLMVGLSVGGLYMLWALCVASGVAQALLNSIVLRHVIRPVFVVEQVDPLRAAALALLAGVVGYAVGGGCCAMCRRSRVRGQSLSID
jgi:hypothetical protein